MFPTSEEVCLRVEPLSAARTPLADFVNSLLYKVEQKFHYRMLLKTRSGVKIG